MSDLIPHDKDPSENHADSADQSESPQQERAEYSRRPRRHVPTAEECAQNLADLSGLVAMGLIKPAQANAIRANTVVIMGYHSTNAARGGHASLANDDVLELAARDPAILAMLEPFLNDEQISLIVGRQVKNEQA